MDTKLKNQKKNKTELYQTETKLNRKPNEYPKYMKQNYISKNIINY